MTDEKEWTFFGFESPQEGRPVQRWFDLLCEDDKDEIRDLLLYLKVGKRLWRKPEYDPLIGEGGISEIRVPDIRDSRGTITYRIYGWFGPRGWEYTFLHATDKKVRNDKDGKRIAKNRLGQIEQSTATVHRFVFQRGLVVSIETGTTNKR